MSMPESSSCIDAADLRGLGPPLGKEASGKRLDLFLARKFPFNSRDEWKKICAQGHLFVNERPAKATKKLRSGDRLAKFHPISAEPDVDTGIALIAESAGIMALFKPANLPMHESGYYRRNTFASLVAEQFGPGWAPVHRLDRETSGIVICASNPDLRRQLSLDFETRVVSKRYLAIARGLSPWDELDVTEPLAFEENDRIPKATINPKGAASHTFFRVLARHSNATLFEVFPHTGRPNQIRAHAAWAGFPLIGDKIYQLDPQIYDAYSLFGDTPEVQALAGFKRHALHAAGVTITHPLTKNPFTAESPLPPDLLNLWSSLSYPEGS